MRTAWSDEEVTQTIIHNSLDSQKYDLIRLTLVCTTSNRAFGNFVTSQNV